MKNIAAISILLLGFFFSSAGRSEGDLTYKQVLKKYHRHGERFNLDTMHINILWDVVYKSGEFREAYERKYAQIYRLSDAELQTRIEESRQEAALGPEFYVVLFTYDKKWNDLDSKDTFWRLRLEVGDEFFEPVSVVKIKPTPLDSTFYPYLQPWSKVYSVLFPKGSLPSDVSEFKLSLFGPKGQHTLLWKFSK